MKKLSLKDTDVLISTWFGSGLRTPAPGTWGTLGAMPFGIGLLYLGVMPLLIAVMISFVIGLWATERTQAKAGAGHDPSFIVIDEVFGVWLTLAFCGFNALHIILAFVLFRLFDILKPWPISYFDKKITNAFGVMIDDGIAGLMAGLVILAGRYYNVI